ncbi:hypothetical protein RSM1_09195 [Methylobacterium radiotolerans]|nr:hypothetical protein RSM1_09195 [Methylobacterium radiotolerans]
MLSINQDFCRQKPEGCTEHGFFTLRVIDAREQSGDHVAQQAVKLRLDLRLNGRQETQVDEIELILCLRLAKRFGSMDSVRVPGLGMPLEERIELIQRNPLGKTGLAFGTDPPDADIVLAD